jgi:hypothetical protein
VLGRLRCRPGAGKVRNHKKPMCQKKLNDWGCTITVVLGLVQGGATLRAQEMLPNTSTNLSPNEAELEETVPVQYDGRTYNLRLGQGGLNFSAGLELRYVDNVFLSNTGRRDDYIISPVGDVAFFYPLGRGSSNVLTLDVGISYYQYTQNRELNTGTPIINPTTELAFDVHAGEVTLRPSEAFSYQESPVYETGGEFFNFVNTGRLARYDNLAGLALKWERHPLVVDAAYYHENLWARDSSFSEIDHSSELLNADVMYPFASGLTAGLETWGSINRFDNDSILNSWRVRAGPGMRWNVSQFLNLRAGGGYEYIDYDSGAASAEGINALNTFYFYARLEHDLTQFLSHALEGTHDNQLGYNAGNLEGYHITYTIDWRPRERLTLAPNASVNWYREAFGTSIPGLYNERFTYYLAGVTATYQFGRHLRANLGWEFRLDASETPGRSYYQNQAAIGMAWAF